MERKTVRKVSSWRKYSDWRCYHQRKSATACDWLYIQSTERHAGGIVLWLPSRKLNWCRIHFSSARLVRLFCIIISSHNRMWVIACPFQCTILQSASQYFCSCVWNTTNTEWEKSLYEDLKNQQQPKNKGLHPVKKLDSTVITRFPESDLFHHTDNYFRIVCIYDATCQFCICAYHWSKENTHYACQTAVVVEKD